MAKFLSLYWPAMFAFALMNLMWAIYGATAGFLGFLMWGLANIFCARLEETP